MREETRKSGIPSVIELMASPGYPTDAELDEKPLAVIECIEKIPCDPCGSFCPFGAIEIREPIHGLPYLLAEKCRGCALCVALCPGQAIFLIDKSYSDEKAALSFVYEFLPLPRRGGRVSAVDREGRRVCEAIVIKVDNQSKYDRSPVVTIAIPKERIHQVRGIHRGIESESAAGCP